MPRDYSGGGGSSSKKKKAVDAYVEAATESRYETKGKAALHAKRPSFLDQVAKTGGSTMLTTLQALDVPRRFVDKTPIGRVADMLRDEHPKGVLGFLRNAAVDTVEDPLTYISFGTSALAKQGLKDVGRELGTQVVKDVAERGASKALTKEARAQVERSVAERVGDKQAAKMLRAVDRSGRGGMKFAGRTVIPGKTFSPVTREAARARDVFHGTRLGEAFVPRAAIKARQGSEAADIIGSEAARARAAAGHATEGHVKTLLAAAKQAKPTEQELRDIVLPAIDIQPATVEARRLEGAAKKLGVAGKVDTTELASRVAPPTVAVPERLQPLVDALKAVREETTAKQLAEGVLPHVRDEYVPLELTKAGRKALSHEPALAEQAALGSGPTELGSAMRQGGHLNPRTLMPNSPLHEVESVMGGKLRDAGRLRAGQDLVEHNPLTLMGKRAAYAERAVAHKQMLDRLAERTTASGDRLLMKAEEGVARPAGWTEFDVPEVGKYYAPKEIADEVTHVRDVLINDDALREFNGLLGRLNTLWKGYATSPIIGGTGFHSRNATGNIWLNFLAGVKNPKDYLRATRIQKTLATGGKDALSAADRRLVDLAEREGVLDSGFFLSELTDPHNAGGRLGDVGKSTTRKVAHGANLLSTDNAVIRSGRAVGSAVENNARLAHFIAKMREFGDPEEAAKSVRKFLFDYQDLTPTERSLKKVAAFYTFQRKNLPLEIEMLARNPGKFSSLSHLYLNAADAHAPMPAAPWAIRSGMLPVTNGPNPLMVGVDLPATSAMQSLDPSLENVLGQFGGFLPSLAKLAVETRTQKSLFTGGHVKGSGLDQTVAALFPLAGKVDRAPYLAALRHDPQALARLLSNTLGTPARQMTPQTSAKRGSKGRTY